MTRVDTDAWIPRAKKRKAFRDHYREKFFSDVGLQKGSHVQQISGAPEGQARQIKKLLALTASGSILEQDQKSHINTALDAISMTGLGTGEMGGTSENRDILDRYSMRSLRKNWFWSPSFFD